MGGMMDTWLRRLGLTKRSPDPSQVGDLDTLSNEQLMALMRHEAHRIEKTIYNDILEKKYPVYRQKWVRVGEILGLLERRQVSMDEPTIAWARQIHVAFDDLPKQFIQPNSSPAQSIDNDAVDGFVDFVRARRSVRVWSDEQPDRETLLQLAKKLVDAARWAPTSGNRQPWRFKVLVDAEKKELLRGIKEEHCVAAPLLVFVGMDTRVYGALGRSERGVYIDAGAAVMQMVLAAHRGGYGVCWNHFADDLVNSRKSNQVAYGRFTEVLGIGAHIAPVAVVAVGRPAFIPPMPARIDVEDLILPEPS